MSNPLSPIGPVSLSLCVSTHMQTHTLKLLSNQSKAILWEQGLFIYNASAKFTGFSIINDNETYQAM